MPGKLIKEKFSTFYVGGHNGDELVTGYRWCDDPPMYILSNGYLADGPIPKDRMLHDQATDQAIELFMKSTNWDNPHFIAYFLNLIDHGNPYDRLSDDEVRWHAPHYCNVRVCDGNIVGHASTFEQFQKACRSVYPNAHRLTFTCCCDGYFAYDFAHRYTLSETPSGLISEQNYPMFTCKFDDKYIDPMPDEDDGRD